ncbi:MAG: hypothetical protein E3J64_06105 [Anaerolineales bacterium]|nr:MAG: hypothetical protein E3J64_06105 [Anaerolineales bacterium]
MLLLIAMGAALVFTVEWVYLVDIYGTRMNTVFKFYFQVWVLWGLGASYALHRFTEREPERIADEGRRSVGRGAVIAVAGCLIVAGLVYPVFAIPTRQEEQGRPGTLDGAAHLDREHPDDYAAIRWLNENVSGAPVILESPGNHPERQAWHYDSRVSAHTGLPTLLGWRDHEYQWRGSSEVADLRAPDIETLYTSEDAARVLALLYEYDIEYVYVGGLERARYPEAGLDKFGQMLEIVYQAGSVTIYRR